MDNVSIEKRIAELTDQINRLPKGYICQKTINGKEYCYLQWTEAGKKRSRYLHEDEVELVSVQIEQRKELQAELKTLRSNIQVDHTSSQEDSAFRCTLMHRQTPVADLDLDSDTATIIRIRAVHAEKHLPVGVAIKRSTVDRRALNEWWQDRSIPASRSGVREALETLHVADTRVLLMRCFGLSLSDQYWIRPMDSGMEWESVNFFDNAFSDDIGDVLFGSRQKNKEIHFGSPDSSSDGNLKKRWKIINGKRYLLKGGSNPFRQQPFNEVIATKIMDRLGIPHIPYTVTWIEDLPYSVCEDFITNTTDLIPAWRIIQTQKKANDTSSYQHFVKCAERLGIPNVVPFLDRMIVFDYIIANEDRHFNNFGAIRNAETLEWLGMAPIYDSGSSLGYDKVAPEIRSEQNITCKPFKNHHEEQLKLVSDFSWIDFDRLSDVRAVIVSELSADKAQDYMDERRIEAIAATVERRIDRLRKLASAKRDPIVYSTNDDVTNHTGKDYRS